MDTNELISSLSVKLQLPKESIQDLMEGFVKVMGECGASLDNVSIPSFGVFEVKKRMERIAYHPATGKKLLIPPKVYVNFKPAPALKQLIKDGD